MIKIEFDTKQVDKMLKRIDDAVKDRRGNMARAVKATVAKLERQKLTQRVSPEQEQREIQRAINDAFKKSLR